MSLPSLAIVLLLGSLGLSIALAPISVRRVGVRHVCTAIALLPIGTLLSVILPHLHKGWLEMAARSGADSRQTDRFEWPHIGGCSFCYLCICRGLRHCDCAEEIGRHQSTVESVEAAGETSTVEILLNQESGHLTASLLCF